MVSNNPGLAWDFGACSNAIQYLIKIAHTEVPLDIRRLEDKSFKLLRLAREKVKISAIAET